MQHTSLSETELTLPEELLLLTHDPDNGKALAPQWESAVAGMILFELVLRSHVRIEGEQVRINAAGANVALRDDLLQEAFKRVSRARIKHTARWWVGVLSAGRPRLGEAYRERMARQGILRREQYVKLRFFKRQRFLLQDTSARDATRERLRETLLRFHNGAAAVDLDARAMLLLPVIHVMDLDSVLFTEHELETLADSIERLTTGTVIDQLLREVLGDSGLDTAALIVILSATSDASDADGDGGDGGGDGD